MKTERFKAIRASVLKKIFAKENISDVWRRIVKGQLRKLDLKDIYDYYDFNYSIDDKADSIRNEILSGNYRAQAPIIYKVEKKLGICRHLMLPQPMDALIMQIITEAIYPIIKAEQPSDNAFYSRDRHSVNKPHQVSDSEYENNWRKQWRKMQKEIYNFKNTKKLIVVTDLTNYFDSIDLSTLREVILGIVKNNDEVLIDLLFRIIEEISWKPDYLPYKKHGLPTINIESIRLLGHTFLFELDKVLKSQTDNSFARWMDDITIGVDDKKEATQVLSGMSDVLKSRGLALNLSKTDLYTIKDFEFNFLIETNQFLDKFEKLKKPTKDEIKELQKIFKKHLNDRRPQHWGKVTKRFITSFGRRKIKISKQVESLYEDVPSLRSSLCIYLSTIGYSKQSSETIMKILSNLNIHDDISLFYLCKVVTDWNVPVNKQSEKFIKDICGYIQNDLQFYCLIWIKAKYDHPEDLLFFIEKFKPKWQKSTFLRRQITAILARLYVYNPTKIEKLLQDQIQSGIVDTISIANHILNFTKQENMESKITFYLFPEKLNFYSLERFLVLCSVLNSDAIRKNEDVRKKIKKHIVDEYFKRWLDISYNIR